MPEPRLLVKTASLPVVLAVTLPEPVAVKLAKITGVYLLASPILKVKLALLGPVNNFRSLPLM